MVGGRWWIGTLPTTHYRPSTIDYRPVVFCYHPEILEQLERHGIKPSPSTPPERVHEFVSDLYRYELRRLRDRLVKREIPKEGYFERVVALRRKYPIVSLKPHQLID